MGLGMSWPIFRGKKLFLGLDGHFLALNMRFSIVDLYVRMEEKDQGCVSFSAFCTTLPGLWWLQFEDVSEKHIYLKK